MAMQSSTRLGCAMPGWLPWLGYAAALALAPWLFDSSLGLSLLSQIGVAIIACLSYNLLLGQGGMLSFGHAVYSGAGAFAAMHALRLWGSGGAAVVALVPLAGGLAALLLALPLGWISTRRSGVALAMITLGMGELVWATAQMAPAWFGGEGGLSGDRALGPSVLGVNFGAPLALYVLVALYTWVCTAALAAIRRTPLGFLLAAVRDNPDRVAFLGYDPKRVRFQAFVVAAFFAGLSGGLAALVFEIVTSEVFSASRSGAYLVFTYLGGTPYFVGPIIGAVLMVLTQVLLSSLTRAWLLYLGLLFVAMVMLAPGGVASLAVRGLQALRRGQLRRRWGAVAALLACAGLGLVGMAAMVEMVYHLQLRDTWGTQLQFLGVALDAQSPGAWVGALVSHWTGAGLFVMCWRRLRRDRRASDAASTEGAQP